MAERKIPPTRKQSQQNHDPKPKLSAKEFLSLLFKSKLPEQVLLIWVKDKPRGGTSYWFHDLAEAAKCAVEQSKKFDTYFGISLGAHKKGKSQRVQSDEAAAIPGLWCEVDFQTGDTNIHKKDEALPANENEALALIHEMPYAPTIVLDSGHGLHCYWLFRDGLWQLENDATRERAQAVVEKWQRLLKDKAAAHGWTNDSTFDLARVYRVAGTKNFKDPKHRKPVEVIEFDDGRRYDRDMLVAFVDKLPVEAKSTKQKQDRAEREGGGGKLVLDPEAAPPWDKFQELQEAEPKFLKSWLRKRSFKDQSASSYDLSLANFAAAAGWTDQEICNLLIAFRRKHGEDLKLRQDYYQNTIAEARRGQMRAEDVATLAAECASGRDGQASVTDGLEAVSKLIGIQIEKVERFFGDPPSYYLHVQGVERRIEMRGVKQFDQKPFAELLLGYARYNMPPFKPRVWHEIVTALVRCAEELPNYEKATYLGALTDWLQAYLRGNVHAERVEEAQQRALLNGQPGLLDGAFWFPLRHLRSYISTEFGDPTEQQVLSRRLTTLGCKFVPVKSIRIGTFHTSRSLWCVPRSLFSKDEWREIMEPEKPEKEPS